MTQPGSPAQGMQIGAASTKEEIRAALAQLYTDMEKEPTAQITWAVHQLIEKLERMVDGREPAEQKPSNEMENVMGTEVEGNVTQRLVSFLLQHPGVVEYETVYREFSGENQRYIAQCLSQIKRGEIPLPKTGGARYRASGNRRTIIIERIDTELEMPASRTPGRKADRMILFLQHNPGASDADIGQYVGVDEKAAKRLIAVLRGDGLIERNSRQLTERGAAAAQRISSGEKPQNSLVNRMRNYFADRAGTDISREDFYAAFSDARRATLGNYWKWFAGGKEGYDIDGYTVIVVGENKIRFEKTAAPEAAAPVIGTDGHDPDAVLPSYREEAGRLYAPEAGSVEDIYKEFPGLAQLIGNRKGLEQTVLKARNSVGPERAGRFYETIGKIPLDHGLMGNPHNKFLKLAIQDQDSAYKMMAWALQQGSITTEAFTAEIGRYETALANRR